MGGPNSSGTHRGQRCWSFADCIFDEGNWTLAVGGRRVSVEAKPLELLRQLLLRHGDLVSKSELLDTIWPDVTVVEASLPTAVRKLRVALDDDLRETHIIQTVPTLGYRLAVHVEVQEVPGTAKNSFSARLEAAAVNAVGGKRVPVLYFSLVVVVLALAVAAPIFLHPRPRPPPTSQEIVTALRRLDLPKIDSMIADGWRPDAPLDSEQNNALNRLLETCEWDPGHDRAKMLLVARALVDGGSTLNKRNIWGDTPYSIAKAARYCGPDHPVTKMIRNMCYAHGKQAGDRCLASYEQSAKR
jgi:DNA-binding winged helix-turn-helix (wHTH) protein